VSRGQFEANHFTLEVIIRYGKVDLVVSDGSRFELVLDMSLKVLTVRFIEVFEPTGDEHLEASQPGIFDSDDRANQWRNRFVFEIKYRSKLSIVKEAFEFFKVDLNKRVAHHLAHHKIFLASQKCGESGGGEVVCDSEVFLAPRLLDLDPDLKLNSLGAKVRSHGRFWSDFRCDSKRAGIGYQGEETVALQRRGVNTDEKRNVVSVGLPGVN
jgi:hypothetical protein